MKEILVKHPKIIKKPRDLLKTSSSTKPPTEPMPILMKEIDKTITNDDIDLMQTLEAEDVSDRLVKFEPFSIWNNSEDNEVEYILPVGYSEYKTNQEQLKWTQLKINNSFILAVHNADWIGVFHEDFSGLDEHLAYDWVTSSSRSHHSSDPHMRRIKFSASIDLPLNGNFVLMYFKLSGTWGHATLMGISEPFSVIKRTPSPRPDTID